MPPYVVINQEDVENFHRDVQSYLDEHNGIITYPVLLDKLHRIEYYYGNGTAQECLDHYEYTGHRMKDKYGLERYQLWRKKS